MAKKILIAAFLISIANAMMAIWWTIVWPVIGVFSDPGFDFQDLFGPDGYYTTDFEDLIVVGGYLSLPIIGVLWAYFALHGKRLANYLLAVFLFIHGVLYLFLSIISGLPLYFWLAIFNITITVFLFLPSVKAFQKSKREWDS